MIRKDQIVFIMRNVFRRRLVYGLILFLCMGGASIWVYQDTVLPNTIDRKTPFSSDEVSRITARVARFVLLPKNEVPIIGIVVDPSLLASQPFFTNSQKGDVVLVFASYNKAILYSPARNLIITIAALTDTALPGSDFFSIGSDSSTSNTQKK